MGTSFLRIIGHAFLKSNLSLEEIGAILSQQLFGGAPFGGKEKDIHEEVPAIFIASPIMGLRIILDGYSGFDPDAGFCLEIMPWITPKDTPLEDLKINNYLTQILKIQLKGVKDIVVRDSGDSV